MNSRQALSPWQLAVHGAMLRDVPARDALELIKSSGYDGIFCELPAGVHELPDLNGVEVTCVGFAPDDQNPIAPGRAVEIAEALHARSVRVCGASMSGRSYQAAYEATLRDCEAYAAAARKRGLLRLVRALRRSGYQGWLTLADRCQGPSSPALLEVDRRLLQQAFDDLEGIGSHNPLRPLDDHVDVADRPTRDVRAPETVGHSR